VGALEIDLSFMTAKVGLTYPTTLQIVLSPQISRTRLLAATRYYDCGNMLTTVAPMTFGRRRSGYEVRYGCAQGA
jgi:hypothetical protein